MTFRYWIVKQADTNTISDLGLWNIQKLSKILFSETLCEIVRNTVHFYAEFLAQVLTLVSTPVLIFFKW